MTRPLSLFALWLAATACTPKHVYPDGGGLVGQLNREVAALRQTVNALEYEAATCKEGRTEPGAIYQELHQILKGTELTIERQGRITKVTFPAAHLFGIDRLSLRQEAQMTLDMVATALRNHTGYRVDIEGHTDDVGVPVEQRKNFQSPLLFTAARAHALADRLIAEGVEPHRISVLGRGSSDPLTSNDTDAGRRVNRRVVVYLIPTLQD